MKVTSNATAAKPTATSTTTKTGSAPENVRKFGTVSGCPAVINPAGHYIAITVNTASLKAKYAGQILNVKVYELRFFLEAR